jgi:hypothetical protein
VAIRARFKGKADADGLPLEYLNGVPARDLHDDEYDALDTDQKRQVRSSGLYLMVDAKAKADKQEADEPPKQEGGGA